MSRYLMFANGVGQIFQKKASICPGQHCRVVVCPTRSFRPLRVSAIRTQHLIAFHPGHVGQRPILKAIIRTARIVHAYQIIPHRSALPFLVFCPEKSQTPACPQAEYS